MTQSPNTHSVSIPTLILVPAGHPGGLILSSYLWCDGNQLY
jgi:hypothetical protein